MIIYSATAQLVAGADPWKSVEFLCWTKKQNLKKCPGSAVACHSVSFLVFFFFLDPEMTNIIDKLANFVARNGPEFEQMTKQKQRDNSKFGFLFGGEYFNYYQYKVTTEQAST